MVEPRIKYTEPPLISFNAPDCGSCGVELSSDGDGWECPVCGTMWSYKDSDETPGTLYEDWSGEKVDLEPLDAHEDYQKIFQITIEHDREKRAEIQRSLDRILAERKASANG